MVLTLGLSMNLLEKRAIIDAYPGDALGVSDWVHVTQNMINHFSKATLDDDPMHADPEWAIEKGPFGHTVAYGFQTMALLTHLFHSASNTDAAREPDQEGYFLNLGFDKMRLVSPVPVNSRIRGRFTLADRVVDAKNRTRFSIAVEVEIADDPRLALAGTWLGVWVPPER